jgi:ribonucleoside-diphosphate reductase alpha chain
MQATWQNYIDASISSTVNVPNEFSVEDVANLYIEAWKAGLKGITVFRDGCERAAILSTGATNKSEEKEEPQNVNELKRGDIICVSDDLLSIKRTIVNGCGKFYLHVDFDEDTGEPLETFIDIGSGGGCERNLQFISRLISLSLRAGVPLNEIIDQTTSIRPCKAYTDRTAKKKDTSKGTSCPSAIGHALKELQEKINSRCFIDDEDLEDIEFCGNACEDCSLCSAKENTQKDYNKSKCPECGEPIAFEGGCNVCKNCGWSKCD